MRIRLATLLLALAPAAALAQQAAPVAIPLGVPADFSNIPATFDFIPKAPGARAGKVWVRSADDGLHIHVEVNADPKDLRWPAEKKDMLASDHVEVWLSTTDHVEMPPVGYGNQFGENDLKTADDCVPKDDDGKPGDPNTPDVATCRKWYASQLKYRSEFERLFTRQWLAAAIGNSNGTEAHFEDFAATTYEKLSAGEWAKELPDLLRPKADDSFTSSFGSKVTSPTSTVATGYFFNIVIPWGAFPPTDQLNLHYLWLMVDVFAHAPDGMKMGALSTTSPARVWGKPATFNKVILKVPRRYSISPCDAAPTLTDLYGVAHPAWYFPTAGREPLIINNVFDIENPATGYMYAPDGVSPVVRSEEHFSKSMPDGAMVCGPELDYRNGKVARTSNFVIDPKHLDLKRLDDGWLLVRSGPTMTVQNPGFGSGQCGACDVEMMQLYAISPKGDITQALDLSDRIQGNAGDPDAVDYGFSSDWSRITYFDEFPDDPDDVSDHPRTHASSVTYCFKDHKYEECEKADKAKMPSPPKFMPQQSANN